MSDCFRDFGLLEYEERGCHDRRLLDGAGDDGVHARRGSEGDVGQHGESRSGSGGDSWADRHKAGGLPSPAHLLARRQETATVRFNRLRPFVQVVRDDDLRELDRPSLNRFPNTADWVPGGTLSDVLRGLNQPICIHRKAW